MKIVLHFDGSEALRARVTAMGVELCPESDDTTFSKLLPDMEVLWHVLKPVTAEVIARAPKLRLIQKIGIGVNTIDLEAARLRGIAVCNLPGTNSRAVAEMTLALMLACLRRLPDLHEAIRKTKGWYEAWQLQDHLGEIGGRTVGLVGFGAVPKLLAPILQAMGANVLFWSRSHRNAELEELIAASDIVSLHLPLTGETASIVDVRRMKRGAILVNTARGGLVDQDVLLAALKSGHLSAAGLDVFAEEPLRPDHPLLLLKNVVCAPHLAWLTRETLERSLSVALENADRLQKGFPLLHRVA
ncbi:MAG TPA: 2-hydroxyacid dehydrogenase [Burkholderiales bacterium]|nr:2-hydroxyacid dehydrogenase [Burkholderiales bacterium]